MKLIRLYNAFDDHINPFSSFNYQLFKPIVF
jgi:hypothetical protein